MVSIHHSVDDAIVTSKRGRSSPDTCFCQWSSSSGFLLNVTNLHWSHDITLALSLTFVKLMWSQRCILLGFRYPVALSFIALRKCIPLSISFFRCYTSLVRKCLHSFPWIIYLEIADVCITYNVPFLGTIIQITLDCSSASETSAFVVQKTSTNSWYFWYFPGWLSRLSYCRAS